MTIRGSDPINTTFGNFYPIHRTVAAYAFANGVLNGRLHDDSMRRTFALFAGERFPGDFSVFTPDGTIQGLALYEEGGVIVPGEDTSGCCFDMVDDFHAVPDGVADTTAAWALALASTQAGDRIYVPPGTYMVDTGALVWPSRTFFGGKNGSVGPVIKARNVGTDLVRMTGGKAVGLTFDGAGLSQNALHVDHASKATVQSCVAKNALAYGMLWDESRVQAWNVSAQDSAIGHRILGCDDAKFYQLVATNCVSYGLELVGVGSGLTAFDGGCCIFGGLLDVNGTDGISPQAIIKGCVGGYMAGMYLEGGELVWIQNDTLSCVFDGLRGVGSVGRAYRLISCRLCTFTGNEAPVAGYASFFCQSPANVGSNTFRGNYRDSAIQNELMPLILDDGITSWTATPADFGLVAAGPPPLGRWEVGTRVWSDAAGSPIGWICTASGTPGTWAAFG